MAVFLWSNWQYWVFGYKILHHSVQPAQISFLFAESMPIAAILQLGRLQYEFLLAGNASNDYGGGKTDDNYYKTHTIFSSKRF